jgi:hypothetical protein
VTRGVQLLAMLLGLSLAVPALALERVRGVLHVHSELSTGDFALESLVEVADRHGIGALPLSANHRLRVESVCRRLAR